MSWLVRLYPRAWRRRYAADLEATLAEWRPGPRDTCDLLVGAVDAHLHPQWQADRRWTSGLAAAVVAVVAGIGSHVLAIDEARVVMAGGPLARAAAALDASLGFSPGGLLVQ